MKLICSVCNTPLDYTVENDDPEDFTYSVTPCKECSGEAYNSGYESGYNYGYEAGYEEGLENYDQEPETESE